MSEINAPSTLRTEEYQKLPPHEKERYVREVIRQTVNLNLNGVTVSQLSETLPFGTRTIEKHLSILTYTNEIYTVKVGPTYLYLPNSRLIHPTMKETVEVNGRTYSLCLLQNRFGEFAYIQEKKEKGLADEVGGGILIPLSGFERFVNALNQYMTKLQKIERG